MKTVSAALKAHLEGSLLTVCTLWKVTRTDGLVFGFTDHDQNVTFSGITYLAATGHNPSSIKTTAQLNVDNLEVQSMLSSSTITEADIQAGLWDFAGVLIQVVNYNDLTMGSMIMRQGWLGNIKTGRHNFVAELRGMTQPLQQQIGRVYAPACDAALGDSRCTVNLANFTVTGNVTTATSARQFTDSTRAEANGYFEGGLITWTARPEGTGTAQAGALTTLTLDANALTTVDAYAGMTVQITGGTGNGQSGIITASNQNLLVYSQAIDNAAYTKSQLSVTPNVANAPDGTATMDFLVPTANSAEHYADDTVVLVAGVTYNFSAYVKAGPAGSYRHLLRVAGLSVSNIYTDLSTGTIVLANGAAYSSSSIQNIGGGIYRVKMQFIATASGATVIRQQVVSATNQTVFAGDGTSGIYIWGMQLTPGDSEYIHTEANPAVGVTVSSQWSVVPDATSNYLIPQAAGDNYGYRMEVKTFANGVVTLQQSMPNAISVGDTYSMSAGCDKLRATCVTKFNNIVNFRGFPDLPGQDAMISGVL